MNRLTIHAVILVLVSSQLACASELQMLVSQFEALAPKTVKDLTPNRVGEVRRAGIQVSTWVFKEVWAAQDRWDTATDKNGRMRDPAQVARDVERVVKASITVDKGLRRTLKLRSILGKTYSSKEKDRDRVRSFLRISNHQIDLSGKIRYALRDLVDNGSLKLDPHLAVYNQMLSTLRKYEVDIGAHVLAYAIFDPDPDTGAMPYPARTKQLVFELLKAAKSPLLMQDLADFVREGKEPTLVWQAAQILMEIGVPQDARPDDRSAPAPEITAAVMAASLRKVDASKLAQQDQQLLKQSIVRLDERAKKGVVGDQIRVAGMDLQVGDWLLMRNPSPYNQFTNLSPGIFTHVGVVTTEQGKDGKRRFVIVEMPERGRQVPSTNIDAYLKRTLHYLFLRHNDPKIAAKLGELAAKCQGRPTHFDLNFQTKRVRELTDTPLEDINVIHTYCAGFLLLCAQRTGRPEKEFFPILENSAGGHCGTNLKKLGLVISDDFVSPTGPLFSPHFSIVGHRNPMYDPGREIRETVFNHFAESMSKQIVELDPGLYQRFRQSLVRLAKGNSLLQGLLAKANNVSDRLDLDAAARAATAIEILDEVADGQMAQFFQARQALTVGELEPLKQEGWTPEQIDLAKRMRKRHAQLFTQFNNGKLTPSDLRQSLVDYYNQAGRREIDKRFFNAKKNK